MNRSVRGWSVKSFERSNGLDTALYKTYLYLLLMIAFTCCWFSVLWFIFYLSDWCMIDRYHKVFYMIDTCQTLIDVWLTGITRCSTWLTPVRHWLMYDWQVSRGVLHDWHLSDTDWCMIDRYHELFYMIDTCQAESMHQKFYSPNILAVASSKVGEDSLSVRPTFPGPNVLPFPVLSVIWFRFKFLLSIKPILRWIYI